VLLTTNPCSLVPVFSELSNVPVGTGARTEATGVAVGVLDFPVCSDGNICDLGEGIVGLTIRQVRSQPLQRTGAGSSRDEVVSKSANTPSAISKVTNMIVGKVAHVLLRLDWLWRSHSSTSRTSVRTLITGGIVRTLTTLREETA
jgi:hypothetical protein